MFSKAGKKHIDTVGKVVESNQQKKKPQQKELKDQRLTLAIRETAMKNLKNLAALRQTTLNNYVNELIEADVENNREILEQFAKFSDSIE